MLRDEGRIGNREGITSEPASGRRNPAIMSQIASSSRSSTYRLHTLMRKRPQGHWNLIGLQDLAVSQQAVRARGINKEGGLRAPLPASRETFNRRLKWKP